MNLGWRWDFKLQHMVWTFFGGTQQLFSLLFLVYSLFQKNRQKESGALIIIVNGTVFYWETDSKFQNICQVFIFLWQNNTIVIK